MGTYETSAKSLMQGVSQQNPEERLDGQLTAQENMLSDPVTGLRRRPGVKYRTSLAWEGASTDSILGWFTDIAGVSTHVLLNTTNGEVKLLNSELTLLETLDGGAYLTTDNPSAISAASVGDEFYILNVDKVPTTTGTFGAFDPATGGFFYAVAGSFSREYSVTVTDSVGSYTVSYTTPTGSAAGDAALATPTYIATQLYNALVALGVFNVYITAAYVFIRCTGARTNMAVGTSTGSAYLIASKSAYVTASGNLPAQLPAQADGFICKVGDYLKPQYYEYDSTTTVWLECAAYGSSTGISNMPVSIQYDTGWSLNSAAYEGRTSGDDLTNPDPYFVDYGISGLGAFQGRLVLLAGPMVGMSASNTPRRFYRTTVTSVVASDPIEVGSSMNSSAAYRYAIPFQKDLVLFSNTYQALVPSNNTVVTPSNAIVVPTSGHATDTTSPPVVVGRTMMYAMPRSGQFFGIMEMLPSPYTDAQYVSQDSTVHLPKYFGGRCRFSASSSTAGMAVFAPSGDKYSLIVHEYQWDGDKKAQQAWHRWTFNYEVAYTYFASEIVYVLFAQNDTLVLGSIDPRTGVLAVSEDRIPYLDLYSTSSIVEGVVTPPSWLLTFDPEALSTVKLSVPSGNLAGDEIGFTVDGSTLLTVRSFQTGSASIGVPFRSAVAPTPPVVKDANGVAIKSNKCTVLRFLVGTKNSHEYEVSVSDVQSSGSTALSTGALYWSSQELALGRAKFSTDAVAIVPARTNAETTVLELATEGSGEMNITSIEYVIKYNQKITRR